MITVSSCIIFSAVVYRCINCRVVSFCEELTKMLVHVVSLIYRQVLSTKVKSVRKIGQWISCYNSAEEDQGDFSKS